MRKEEISSKEQIFLHRFQLDKKMAKMPKINKIRIFSCNKNAPIPFHYNQNGKYFESRLKLINTFEFSSKLFFFFFYWASKTESEWDPYLIGLETSNEKKLYVSFWYYNITNLLNLSIKNENFWKKIEQNPSLSNKNGNFFLFFPLNFYNFLKKFVFPQK